MLDRCIRPNLKRAVTVISGDFEYLLAQCATGRSDHARIYLLSITEILEPNFFGYYMVIIRWSNDCPNFWGFWDCTESRLNECYQRQHWFKLNAVPYCTEFSCALSGTDWKSLILSRTTLNKAECCPGHSDMLRWALSRTQWWVELSAFLDTVMSRAESCALSWTQWWVELRAVLSGKAMSQAESFTRQS